METSNTKIINSGTINVYSSMNPWIDFIIIVDNEKQNKAQEIIQVAFDEWFNINYDICISDYIRDKLMENNISNKVYSMIYDDI